jgi:hypothetical protein
VPEIPINKKSKAVKKIMFVNQTFLVFLVTLTCENKDHFEDLKVEPSRAVMRGRCELRSINKRFLNKNEGGKLLYLIQLYSA